MCAPLSARLANIDQVRGERQAKRMSWAGLTGLSQRDKPVEARSALDDIRRNRGADKKHPVE